MTHIEFPMYPIIDTHQHLWDLSKFQLNWMTPDSPLGQSFTPKEYAEATAGLGVVKSIYMEVDVVKELQQAEADYVVGLCEANAATNVAFRSAKGRPFAERKATSVAAVVGGHPADPGFPKYVRQFEGSPYVKGVRQCIHVDNTPAGYCLQPAFIDGVRLLGNLGLRYDICIRPGELGDAVKLVDACPGTKFILDHCGNGPVRTNDRTQWQRDMDLLGKKPNLVCKVSGIVASAEKGKWVADDLAPLVNHTIASFGWDRVMFGGDWPVCTLTATYKQWVDALRSIVADRKDEEQRKLFHDNAMRVYDLT